MWEEAQQDGQLNYVYFYGRKIGLFIILSCQNNLFANEFVLGLFFMIIMIQPEKIEVMDCCSFEVLFII